MVHLTKQRNPKTEPESPRDQVKTLILKTLGIRKVAGWCDVGEAAVYQWLNRGSDEKPIPPDFVPLIIAGARADGVEIPVAILWPAAAGVLT